ncbi:hypothetical protein K1T71_000110 [Dendrolimus kikuchii]|uniref:Uncharacterized protein n=1 Tax=Dendrolimus kikuchii TaxID=765133 RepID=A0ACC1DJ93_9NEOP|nr:hypothetical protein K1T71_000110 [Dendrolimus kikuchii]
MKAVNLFKKVFVMALLISAIIFIFFWTDMEMMSIENVGTIVISKTAQLNVKNKLCYVNYNDERHHMNNKTDLKMIYYVTPTYPRPEQVPELTRLGHTLMHVPRIHWIIADDQPICSDQVLIILRRTGLPYTHISSPKPYVYRGSNFPRGVANRRAALSWLRDNVQEGVLYFGDDDNTVDLQLFEEIRNTKKVSMFPVGLIGDYGISAPIVKDGKVVAFFDSWPGSRKFPVDMAGFAVNMKYITSAVTMPFIAGHEEDRFLLSLGLKLEDIEPLADNCSRVFVWHTKTVKFKKPNLKMNIKKLHELPKYDSFVKLLNETKKLGMANIFPGNGSKAFIIRNRKTYDPIHGLQ